MLKIYSKSELLPEPVVPSHNEVFFARNISHADLTAADFQVIAGIDKAEPIPNEPGYFKTPFGLAQTKHLSTGCKTVINALHFTDKIFNFAECGGNALSELARVSGELGCDISIYLPRYRNIEPLTTPIMLNDSAVATSDEFHDMWYAEESEGEYDGETQ